jgi:hypothetical protein
MSLYLNIKMNFFIRLIQLTLILKYLKCIPEIDHFKKIKIN